MVSYACLIVWGFAALISGVFYDFFFPPSSILILLQFACWGLKLAFGWYETLFYFSFGLVFLPPFEGDINFIFTFELEWAEWFLVSVSWSLEMLPLHTTPFLFSLKGTVIFAL
jgi:hypothetical protein